MEMEDSDIQSMMYLMDVGDLTLTFASVWEEVGFDSSLSASS